MSEPGTSTVSSATIASIDIARLAASAGPRSATGGAGSPTSPAWSGGRPLVADEVFVPWPPHHLGTVDVLDALPDYGAASQVTEALTEVVLAEGPIHVDRLATLVARGFGLERVRDARKAAILRHLPRRLRRDPAEPVVWPPERDPQEWSGFRRTPEGAERPVEHVPLREIVNAMAALVRASAGMPVEELHRQVLAVFGGRRVTRGIATRLDTALALGMQTGRLTLEQGVVTAAPA